MNGNISLKIGDQGALVLQLQQMLAELGYRAPDGSSVFDSITERSLKAFQNDFRFRVTGAADIRVWDALEKNTGRTRQDVVEMEMEAEAEVEAEAEAEAESAAEVTAVPEPEPREVTVAADAAPSPSAPEDTPVIPDPVEILSASRW